MKSANVLEVTEDESSSYFLGSVTHIEGRSVPALNVALNICGTPVKFKVDSGADITTMSMSN
jgi:hypothetical protein